MVVNSLTIMIGYPASGKSTHIQDITENHPEYVVICPDDFRLEISGKEYDASFEKVVWSTVKTVARVLLKNHRDVILDATNLTKKSRAQWVNTAKDFGCPVHAVWVNTPFKECCKRNNLRNRVVPQDVMDNMYTTFEEPSEDEGFSLTKTELDH